MAAVAVDAFKELPRHDGVIAIIRELVATTGAFEGRAEDFPACAIFFELGLKLKLGDLVSDLGIGWFFILRRHDEALEQRPVTGDAHQPATEITLHTRELCDDGIGGLDHRGGLLGIRLRLAQRHLLEDFSEFDALRLLQHVLIGAMLGELSLGYGDFSLAELHELLFRAGLAFDLVVEGHMQHAVFADLAEDPAEGAACIGTGKLGA